MPNIVQYCPILPNIAKYCQILPDILQHYQILSFSAQYDYNLLDIVKNFYKCYIFGIMTSQYSQYTVEYCHLLSICRYRIFFHILFKSISSVPHRILKIFIWLLDEYFKGILCLFQTYFKLKSEGFMYL